MRTLITILFCILSNSIPGKAVVFQEYFPLADKTVRNFYVSHITKNDTLKDKNDLAICRSVVVKGRKIFYFDDDLNERQAIIIGSQSFCQGAFYYDKGAFMFSPLFWKEDLMNANLDYFEPLFPATISFDTLYKYKDGEKKMTYKFISFEDVTIKKRVYNNCLKLIVTQDWPVNQYVDIVWFQKGFGVVKWLRGTGRLEEFKE